MKSEDLNTLIKNRRAVPVQFYNGEPVSKDEILQILENGNWAPNHKQTEPWRFVVYQGESKKQLGEDVFNKIVQALEKGEKVDPGKADKFRRNVLKAGAVVSIIMQRDPEDQLPEWEEIAAVSMAVQNMWLTAESLGLRAFWSTPKYLPLLKDILGLDSSQKSLGFFFLGKADIDYPSQGRGAIEKKIIWMD